VNKIAWWSDFQRYADTLCKNKKLPETILGHIQSANRLFSLVQQHNNSLANLNEQDLDRLFTKVQQLLDEVHSLENRLKPPKVQEFFHHFAQTIEWGIQELRNSKEMQLAQRGQNEQLVDINLELQEINLQSQAFGHRLNKLAIAYQKEKKIESRQLAQRTSLVTSKLDTFLKEVDTWLQQRCGLTYLIGALHKNLDPKKIPQWDEALPIKIRVDPQESPHTFKAGMAQSNQVSKFDLPLIDIFTRVPQVSTPQEYRKFALQNKQISRFILNHTHPDQALKFTDIPTSQAASKLFDLFLELLASLTPLHQRVIALINQTPLKDLENSLSKASTEDCKTLLRYKFQSVLPGINDDHYRSKQKQSRVSRSIRTIKLMNAYEQKFQEALTSTTKDLKSILAMQIWFKKNIVTTLRDNRPSGKKAAPDPKLKVAISLTLGDERAEYFFIDPADILPAKAGIQRSSKKDQWINVTKSEQLLRIDRQDFFSILFNFCQDDLNPILRKHGLHEMDFKSQLMPEIKERIEDMDRINRIRSGILGTTFSSLKEFSANRHFHSDFFRYFQVKNTHKTQYPYREKFTQLAQEMRQCNPTVLQIKYQKILRIRQQIQEHIKNLTSALQRKDLTAQDENIEVLHHFYQSLRPILQRTLQVMEYSNPALKEIDRGP